MTIHTIILHCSDSPHGRGDNAETIHQWHLANGWSGIGYHYVIDEFGVVEKGRPNYWQGAHVKHHNPDTLGICLIGIYAFTPMQFEALSTLLLDLIVEYPTVKVRGHNHYEPGRACPNFDVKKFLESYGLSDHS
jgi:N-acetylmuramoyl-L-alanine amidase